MTEPEKRLNILFVVQDDPFYVKEFFEEFLNKYADLSEIKGVILCSPLGKKSINALAKQMLDFYGTAGFIKMGLRFAGKKVMAVLSGFFPLKKSYTLKHLFKKRGIYAENTNDINSRSFIEQWKNSNIDLVISVASSVIFKPQLLEMPRLGCINIHHGKLPRYRGMMPNFWQMYYGEKSAGITIHKINPKIDDGAIIIQKEIEIAPNETLDQLIIRSKRLGADLMIDAINLVREGKIQYTENVKDEASYFSFPQKNDVLEFRRRGKRIL